MKIEEAIEILKEYDPSNAMDLECADALDTLIALAEDVVKAQGKLPKEVSGYADPNLNHAYNQALHDSALACAGIEQELKDTKQDYEAFQEHHVAQTKDWVAKIKKLEAERGKLSVEEISKAIFDCCGIKEQGKNFQEDAKIWESSVKNIDELAQAIYDAQERR